MMFLQISIDGLYAKKFLSISNSLRDVILNGLSIFSNAFSASIGVTKPSFDPVHKRHALAVLQPRNQSQSPGYSPHLVMVYSLLATVLGLND